jgi:tripartite-type tricarboxylate transporter receptor subunit TctC
MLSRRRFLGAAASAGIAAPALRLARPAGAQTVAKPARMLVGFAPGGLLDATARLLVEHIRGYAPSLIVDNKPGAGGRISLEALKGAEADGSVMALVPIDQLALYPHIYNRLSYKPLEDFAPVAAVCSFEFLLAVGPRVPAEVKSLADFIAWCRANPAASSFGTGGAGTQPHFIGLAVGRAAGFDFVHVPYKGASPVVQDVLGGHLAAVISSIGSLLPHIQSGGLRTIATAGSRRSAALPVVPTFREAGYPAIESIGSGRMGVIVPARTPADAIAALDKAVSAACALDPVQEGLARLGLTPLRASPKEFTQIIATETGHWAEAVKASGFKPMD